MLQAAGAINVNTKIKSISAVKPSRGSGQTRARNKRGGENVRWKRLTATFDDAMRELVRVPPDQLDAAVALMAANQRIAAPVTRLVYFKHLTVTQGIAARRYASIVRTFERYHVAVATRSARAQDIDKPRAGDDQEIQRHIVRGTIDDYEREARKARKEYGKAQKVLDRYRHEITGRNEAKNVLDDLCLSDIEPPTQYRQNIAAVLQALADAFGVKERR
jgi:hypothetical protein